MNCQLCQESLSKYVCPRCNINYCSLDCYRSESHQQCSEAFYKECIIKELQTQESSSKDQKKILEMLQRVEERVDDPEWEDGDPDLDPEWEDLDSDDSENENDDLANRLSEVDLNNADAVWERLTHEEKQEFKSIVYNGEIEKIVELVEPWWILKLEGKLVRDTEEDAAGMKEILRKCPKIKQNIKDFQELSGKSPAPCVIYNISNVIGTYCYIFRHYNGDQLSYDLEASDKFVNICENLKSNANFDSIATSIDSVMMNCLNLNLAFDLSLKNFILDDVKCILGGPGDAGHSYILSTLSDILNLFTSAKRKFKSSRNAQGNKTGEKFSAEFCDYENSEFKQLENKTHFAACIRKIEFYLSFIKFRYNQSEWPINYDIL